MSDFYEQQIDEVTSIQGDADWPMAPPITFDCPSCEGTGFQMRDPHTWSPEPCETCTPENQKPR